MTDDEKPLHIIELRASNILGLRAVRIRPDGNLIIIGGENGAGKTSLLGSIEVALGGKRAIPPDPVRHGARKASSFLDLGEITVERTFATKGGNTTTSLVVKNAEGVPQKSPQALLDSLCAKVTFDPLAFSRLEPTKQDETLRELLGLDFAELEGKRSVAYTSRTETKRECKSLEAQRDAITDHPNVPKDFVSVSELTAELEKRRDQLEANRIAREKGEKLKHGVEAVASQIAQMRDRIKFLETEIEKADEELVAQAILVEAAERAIAAITEPNLDEVREQIADLEGTNEKIRDNRKIADLDAQLKVAEECADALTLKIEEVDDEKQAKIAAAEFPIEGLGFEDVGVTLNGIPLEQASGAEKLRVSVAIGAALNPRVRVMLVRDGSLLDDESMKLLAELAGETDAQVWLERVGNGDESAIIIEDGEVRE